MKVLYDDQIFSLQKFGGISKYFSEIYKRGNLNSDFLFILSILISENINIKSLPNTFNFNTFQDVEFKGKLKVSSSVNRLCSVINILSKNYDIFHPTYYNSYFISILFGKPYVLTVHDTTHEKLTKLFPTLRSDKFSFDKRLIIEMATIIISVSQTTKNDIIEFYNIDPSKIIVVPLASSLRKDFGTDISKPFNFNIQNDFLLYVGVRRIYKNFDFFLKSIKNILLKTDGLVLVCAGGNSFTTEEIENINNLGLSAKIIHQCINNQTLIELYSKAIAFVFPSLNEGFGIPVIEAMENLCPCVLSDRGSLPEIAEDCAIYFDPTNSFSIESQIEKILNNKDLRKKLISSGLLKSKDFSWNKTFSKTMDVYKSIL